MKKWLLAGLCLMSIPAFAEDRFMTVQHLTNAPSYFNINVVDDGLLSGSYPGWCAQWAKHIEDGVPYKSTYYSSYSEQLPPDLIDHPENLDEMNWLLNQHYVGKTAPGGLGKYTSGDVQLAIWTLLNNNFDTSTVGQYLQARVDYIVSMAKTKGSDYYPKCRDVIGIIIDPGTPQSTIIEIKREHFYKCEVPDGGEE
jgi:hypothetical protein